eukprot:CAMPEP_0116871830 /NCGR_PEP_ID=MMETSP0463-20121206/2339_1 /TAXON_ID=181622 /ORGANISM="Strombidinopsis sp, Strain SopsisLIS2011" /LENGTH=31 /DNA_ID= /DNA_START= /DNA_END= /DNA_ORIENTATION=
MLKESEMWHAKAIHIGSTFLPATCPMIRHMV